MQSEIASVESPLQATKNMSVASLSQSNKTAYRA